MQTEPSGDRVAGIEYGNVVNESDGSYLFTSDVYANSYRTDDRAYENVTVNFYSANQTLITSESIGTIRTGNRETVQKQLTQRPEFIVVVSPSFWKDSNLRIFGLSHKEDGIYVEYRVSEGSLFKSGGVMTTEG